MKNIKNICFRLKNKHWITSFFLLHIFLLLKITNPVTLTAQPCQAEAGSLDYPTFFTPSPYICADLIDGIQIIGRDFNTNINFQQWYLLVDGNNTIIDIDVLIQSQVINELGEFDSPDIGGTYQIYALNFEEESDFIPPVIGQATAFIQNQEDCFQLSESLEILVLNPIQIEAYPFCDPENPDVFFTRINITGGLPAFSNAGSYEINLPSISMPWYPDSSFASGVIGPISLEVDSYTIEVTNDGNLCSFSQTFPSPTDCSTIGETLSILPGDCNNDQYSNFYDLFPIAWGYGATGPARPHATTNWETEETLAWPQDFTAPSIEGINYAHADANGDGVINATDAQVILNNYDQEVVLNNTEYTTDSVPIRLTIEATDTIIPNYEHVFKINLAGVDQQDTEIYGIAFSVQFSIATDVPDSIALRMEQPEIAFTRSWLGTVHQDLITLDTCLKDQFRWDIALARTDQQTRMGTGEICSINCIMEVGPLKTDFFKNIPFQIELTNIYCLNEAGECIHIPEEEPTEVVLSQQNHFSDLNTTTMSFDLSPNPASSWVSVQVMQTVAKPITIHVYDVLGHSILKEVYTQPQASIQLPVNELKQGIYFIQVDDGQQKVHKKLLVTR